MSQRPPLKPLHAQQMLSGAKLAIFDRMTSDALKDSLAPGHEHSLKTRPDGTMLDGHHRIHVLRCRSELVDSLPREVITPETI
jgi:hypothetical protein